MTAMLVMVCALMLKDVVNISIEEMACYCSILMFVDTARYYIQVSSCFCHPYSMEVEECLL